MADRTISIYGQEDAAEDRARLFKRLDDLRYGSREIDRDVLRQRLGHFLETMQGVIDGMPARLGEFSVDTVTLTAQINAKGSISLLGSGGQVGASGGLTFTLTRRPAEAEPQTGGETGPR